MSRNRSRATIGCLAATGLLLVLVAASVITSSLYTNRNAAIAREMAARGYPETADELIAYQNGPFDVPNGADALLAGFEAFNDEGANYDLLPIIGGTYEWQDPPFPLPRDVIDEVGVLLDTNKEMIERLRTGTQSELCRFPVQFDDKVGFGIHNNIGGRARNAMRLLYLRTLFAADKGDTSTALDSIQAMLRLGEIMCDQPGTLAYLTGRAIEGMAVAAGGDLIEYSYLANAEDLKRLATLFERADTADVVRSQWTDTLCSEYELDTSWPTRDEVRNELATNPPVSISDSKDTATDAAMLIAYRYTFVADLDRLQQRELAMLMAQLMNEPLAETVSNMEAQVYRSGPFDKLLLLTSPLTLQNAQALPKIEGQYCAKLRTAATAARVAAWKSTHGRLPTQDEYAEEIPQLSDPFDGKPLRYRIADGVYRIYSVGPNGTDDGGVGQRRNNPPLDDEVTEIRLIKEAPLSSN